jgi:predicted DNA-binding transcriptional regulator AlpA
MPDDTTGDTEKRGIRAVLLDVASADPEQAIDTHCVAKLLGIAEITVVQQRARGEGPPFFRIGRSVRYVLADVLAFRAARTVGAR